MSSKQNLADIELDDVFRREKPIDWELEQHAKKPSSMKRLRYNSTVVRAQNVVCSRWGKIGLGLLFGIPILVLIILIIVVFVRAAQVGAPASTFEELNSATTGGINDGQHMKRALRLADAIKIPTMSYEQEKQQFDAFPKLHKFIQDNFPAIHSASWIQREVVANYSLLFTVTGSKPGPLPYVLASHLDVVPATNDNWESPPFAGNIVDEKYIYGRGTLDDKGGVMGILEALEYMVETNDRPTRSFFLAFGHDEELGGFYGAQAIAKTLKAKGVNKLDFLLDEGMPITRNLFPGPDIPVAFIGVSEKGMATLDLSVTATPGHSSIPPWESAIGILANAMYKVESHKLPSMLGTGPEKDTFEAIAPYSDFNHRMLYANLWLFSGLVTSQLEKMQLTNAFLRTTTAVTIFQGGVKENIVPASARAVVNHRIHPSQSAQQVVDFDINVINDPRVKVNVTTFREPSPVSPYGPDKLNYQLIAKTTLQSFEDIVVAPAFMVANTDTRWYHPFTTDIYRLLPVVFELSDTARVHGYNERISIDSYKKQIDFYYRIIKNAELVYNRAAKA